MNALTVLKNVFFKTRKKNTLLRHAFDNMLEGIQVHDFNWRYTYVNNALVKYSQYSKEELLGNTLMDKYPGIERSDLFKVLERCMTERVSEHFETEFIFPNGSKADFELSIQPVPEGLFILSIDISERKRAEEKQKISETYYRSVIEQANDTIYIMDSSSTPKFMDINRSGCELLGYTKDEIRKLTVFDILFENDFTDCAFNLEELRTGKSVTRERRLKRKDGSAVVTELSAKKMEDGNIMVVVRDISERKKAEEELQKSEMRFRSLIENSSDVILLMDSRFRIIYSSPAAFRMTGWKDEEINDSDGLKNIHPDDLDIAKNNLKDLTTNPGKALNVLFRKLHKNGHYIWMEGTAINLLHNENVKAIVLNLRDITEHREVEQKLKLSEQYYRSIIEQANDTIYITDSTITGKFIDINPSGCKMLGYTKEEFLKLNPSSLILKEDLEKNPIKIEQLKSGAAIRNERRLKRKDGTTVETESNGKMLEDGNFMVFARDITDRKKAEREIMLLNENLERKVAERTLALENSIIELKESEQKFQIAFQTSAAGISMIRYSDSNYLDVNDSFIRMTGFSKEELIGHNSRELGIVTNIVRSEEIAREIKEHGFAKNLEMTLRHKTGREIVILASVETIVLNGEKCGLNIIYDITDRKIAEEQLASLNKELEAFSYSVSHDLRAPLRAIDSYSKMLYEEYEQFLDKEGKRFFGAIQTNVKKMNALIEDLLAFSRLGKREIQKTNVNMQELAQQALLEIRNTQECKAEIKTEPLIPAPADYALMNQVFVNLISNAIKYSSKTAQPRVEIKSKRKDAEVIYSVKDNGAGFDMKYADKLFGVFQRLHSDTEFTGTGVGLAIVQRIVNKHGGKVWAEAELGKGATFYFSLPLYS